MVEIQVQEPYRRMFLLVPKREIEYKDDLAVTNKVISLNNSGGLDAVFLNGHLNHPLLRRYCTNKKIPLYQPNSLDTMTAGILDGKYIQHNRMAAVCNPLSQSQIDQCARTLSKYGVLTETVGLF